MQYHNGHAVKIWEFDNVRAARVRETRNNEPFLVGYTIPTDIIIDWNIEHVLQNSDAVVFAIPSQMLRHVVEVVEKVKYRCEYHISLTKGIDIDTLARPSEIISRLSGSAGRVYVLSGPSIANEIIRNEPTAVVLVGPDVEAVTDLQHQLATDNFRIYKGDDVIGVELGAAIKNVIALGCGISDGLGFGRNAKGALMTRGIVEMQRLGMKCGAQARTFWGLSGCGDLMTTAMSEESRNHTYGRKIGEGKNLTQIAREMIMVAEGVPTSKAVMKLAQQHQVEMPICEVVYDILYHEKSPREGIRDLMTRPLTYE
jgi:glycerol-3-phosphate dehydrogenase (NAD(P)+)